MQTKGTLAEDYGGALKSEHSTVLDGKDELSTPQPNRAAAFSAASCCKLKSFQKFVLCKKKSRQESESSHASTGCKAVIVLKSKVWVN